MNIDRGLYDLIKIRSQDDFSLIAIALAEIASYPPIIEEFPFITNYLGAFKDALTNGNSEHIEEALSKLYVTLHSSGSYTREERDVLRLRGGYLCYPGGLSPILLARSFINKDTVVADLGSGNGLQGLLLQRLYPHRRTIQIEIAKEMIRIGRVYQVALGIKEEKIKWINDDIMNASYEEADLVYIYRPARPVEGAVLYKSIGEKLSRLNKRVTIFSVADCLAPFIKDRFTTHYDDGHLKIFINYEASSSINHSRSADSPSLWLTS
ncbi:MAG: hypothetical protein ACK415_06370 [Thermodesulfovibrionales bacterium]